MTREPGSMGSMPMRAVNVGGAKAVAADQACYCPGASRAGLDHHRGSAYTLGLREHDQHGEPLVAGELVQGAGRHEDGVPLR